jgi:hypothetical protein
MRYLLLPLLVISVVGCRSDRPMEPQHDRYAPGQINVASEHLRANTRVGTATATRDADSNILYVTIPIRSTTNEQMYIDYRVSFFDRNGQLISETGWFTRTLTPNLPDNIQVRSTTPRAADFHVDIRDAR